MSSEIQPSRARQRTTNFFSGLTLLYAQTDFYPISSAFLCKENPHVNGSVRQREEGPGGVCYIGLSSIQSVVFGLVLTSVSRKRKAR